ncbi:dopey-1-like protein [Sarcoptes scabiei]|uniref:Dopey-1-like protein n=1 Tax=Sarcoptes scabiei TaxID=52283 RepID=A0A131ZYT3_SARSC|nr:dopey-1-like protein [Sarcoptes scabiei]
MAANDRAIQRLDFYDFSDQELMNSDNKYRQYALAIDKALKSFEYTSEWADLVNALGKLNRVLTNNSRFCRIPRRSTVGQRLAQCMHPLLPSGVHLKALETYHLIFNCLGKEQLLADLTIYSNGLFPLLGYAAINVRPSVLDLYERHLLPLGDRLKLALDGFLISLLPCYEEGSESFKRTDSLLLNVASSVGLPYFYGALWRCILQNSSIRLQAVTFVLMHFNKKRSLNDQAHILGLCMPTLVRAICSALLDAHILVQRAILDLLITVFPMHIYVMNEMQQAMSLNNGSSSNPSSADASKSPLSPSKSKVTVDSTDNSVIDRKFFKRSELVVIITASLTVLLRRDLSLNRRLTAWFFGSDVTPSSSSSTVASTNAQQDQLSATGLKSYSSNTLPRSSKANSSASSFTSAELKLKRKKTIYFETYSRSLVIEAYKRCITNPLKAISSILPPTALTNSFLSFTLPCIPAYGNQAASAQSSPSTSTSSLLHLHSHSYSSYRTNSLHGNSSRPSYLSMSLHANGESYSSMSTFWPYRLLNCIMDQTEIAIPILDTLCAINNCPSYDDRLFHEFELLTNIVPPPTIVVESRKSKFFHSPVQTSSNLNDSSTTLSSSSLIASTKHENKIRIKSQPKKSNQDAEALSQDEVNSQNANLQSDIKTAISDGNFTVASLLSGIGVNKLEKGDNRSVEKSNQEVCKKSKNNAQSNKNSRKFGGKFQKISNSKKNLGDSFPAEDEATVSLRIKRNMNLFRNLRQNVRDKFNRLPFPLGISNNNTNSKNSNRSSFRSGSTRMKNAMKSFMIKQLRLKMNPNLKLKEEKFAKKKILTKSISDGLSQTSRARSNISPSSASGEEKTEDSSHLMDIHRVTQDSRKIPKCDDTVFILPHQHYYWNPYYQQLSKEQREELLKELDCVMHLLFTNVGVDFIWSKLALIFQSAAEEAIALKKFLNIIVKTSIKSKRSIRLKNNIHCDGDTDSEDEEEDDDDQNVDVEDYLAYILKNKLLESLTNRCRQCGQTLTYNSPVQSVGTNSITVLEACTLVRFTLGDSHPYHHNRHNSDFHSNDSRTFEDNVMSSDSVSASMNRCSALEPLSADSMNYDFLTNFLVHVLELMCRSAKSFTRIDFRASIEMCLSLCSRLKPAIMQTFFTKFKHCVAETKIKNEFENPDHLRQSNRMSLANWFKTFCNQKHSYNRIRSMSTVSSSSKHGDKQLELVREENEDDCTIDEIQSHQNDSFECEELSYDLELRGDLKIETVVDGILDFFSTFVEKILVKRKNIEGKEKSSKSSILDFYRQILYCNRKEFFFQNNSCQNSLEGQTIDLNFFTSIINGLPSVELRHRLLPIYQLLCELVFEVATIPLLSSPALLLKKRDEKNFDSECDSLDQVRWFVYLMILSVNGLSSCTRSHHKRIDDCQPLICCETRHIAYTSLTTLLDLMTMTRAYVTAQPDMISILNNVMKADEEFQIPSYIDMASFDLFPESFAARRLNFFPIVHPRMLQHVYESTFWFKLVASGLWSNLSDEDFLLHHSTAALLQQLHSVSIDESICEVVICDEMIGGSYCGFRSSYNSEHLSQIFNVAQSIQNNANKRNNIDSIHAARSKFGLLFSILKDIRFISERLALVVVSLSSAAKFSDSNADLNMTLTDCDAIHEINQGGSNRMLLQIEFEIASGNIDSNQLMSVAQVMKDSDLYRLLRATCPISPIALCSSLKRHFDRPVFIILDAISHRRMFSDQYSTSIDWLLRCIKTSSIFGTQNLMFINPNGLGVTSEFQNPSDFYQTALFSTKTDIDRLIEPLLFILLHPNTSRLSIKNADIHAINEDCKNIEEYCEMEKNFDHHKLQSNSNLSSLKVYAINSPNGSVIYHIGRKRIASPTDYVDYQKVGLDLNDPNESKAIPIEGFPDEVQSVCRNIVDDILKEILLEFDPHAPQNTIENENPSNSRSMNARKKHFPGTAYFTSSDNENVESISQPQVKKGTEENKKLNLAQMHENILLYGRRYDSSRTSYALDSIINMIETWPARVLYAMSTANLFSINHNGLVFDGSRSAQIYNLYQKHLNSNNGYGFDSNYKNNFDSSNQSQTNRSRTFKKNMLSFDENITSLEIIVYICLQYLRSYYPSGPTETLSSNRRSDSNPKDFAISNNFFSTSANPFIESEAIQGNQKVRLLACQTLRIIFYHLSQMIEIQTGRVSRHQNSNSQKRQQTDSLLCSSQSKSFAHYLKELMKKLEVQKLVLECLVSSVWYCEQMYNLPADGSGPNNDFGLSETKSKTENYLFPNTEELKSDDINETFVKEIFDYNNCDIRQSNEEKSQQFISTDHVNYIHDSTEKALLKLFEQVMILEYRIHNVLDENKSSENVVGVLHRIPVTNMNEMSFDPDLPLAGQPLLNSAVHFALKQTYRHHIQCEWISFIESSLLYAGRFMPRLVLTAVHQLCKNLNLICIEIDQISSSAIFSHNRNPTRLTFKHFLNTLRGIAMIFSYCLLERSQYDILAPVLNEIAEENENEINQIFGLISNHRKRNQFNAESHPGSDSWFFNKNGSSSVSSNGSSGAIQTISSILQNILVITALTGSSSSSSSNTASNSHNSDSTDSITVQQQDTLSNNLFLTRQRILGYGNLNRVITALFEVWCTMVSRDDNFGFGHQNELTACCHPNVRLNQSRSVVSWNDADNKKCKNRNKNSLLRHYQSNCSSGWSSSVFTGWYIAGSSIMIQQSISTILSILTVSNGIYLLKSVARVWHDLRDRSSSSRGIKSESDSLLIDAIDVVVAPVTPKQQKLIQMIGSLSPILNLEYLIQIVRAIMKPSSSINNSSNTSTSITAEVESTLHSFTSNPFDNIFLIETSLLEFFLGYVRTCDGETLLKSWRSMLALIKDCHSLNLSASVPYETFWPRGTKNPQRPIPSQSVQINFQPLINIYLLGIMHEFVITAPFVEDRRAQKELQDVAQRLIDSSISVAGGRLLSSKFWTFRRNFEVIPITNHDYVKNQTRTSPVSSEETTPVIIVPENNQNSSTSSLKRGMFRASIKSSGRQKTENSSENLLFGLFNFDFSSLSLNSNANSGLSDLATASQNSFYSYFCIKALYAMAEFAAPILDVVYASEEKEKMIPLITNLMSHVIPYLKSHSPYNLPCFDACSRLLASISGYQYTRKAWRRESLELLLDSSFFQMPPECFQSWRTIIDHLMTHDKNTFREFLQRMSVAQSPSVTFKIFVPLSVKDQDTEPKAQLVKRLAFILFCSEKDQYQKYMAEIQEKLIEIHRTSQQQNVAQTTQSHSQALLQSQILLAFRVILLRMSPHYLASLWPFIYTEMFQVFLTIEQALLKAVRDEQNDTNISAHLSPSDSAPTIVSSSYFDCHKSSPGRHSLTHNVLRSSKLDPKIPSSQLQLFLNACKLLDLALLLPSDILPQFQLHKWTFVSDADLDSEINEWLSPFYEINSSNRQSSMIDNCQFASCIDSLNDQPSSLNLDINLPRTNDFKCNSETTSLTSNYDSNSTGAPQSLPINLNSTPANNTNHKEITATTTTFIPHIILINQLLNYLTVGLFYFVCFCLTDTMPSYSTKGLSTTSPLLTISSIHSIHDLHPFFLSLYARTKQNSFIESKAERSIKIDRDSLPNAVNFSNSRSKLRKNANRKKSFSANETFFSNEQSSSKRSKSSNNTGGGCSLDELFINIDRIIANDFLEPLPQNNPSSSVE